MHNGTQIPIRLTSLTLAVLLTGILAAGTATAQVPVTPTIEEERVITPGERFDTAVHNMVESPADFIVTVSERYKGTRPNYRGLALITAPVEGFVQGLTRFFAGFAGMIASPFGKGEGLVYDYEHGTSALDPALQKFGRGLHNIVCAPVDIPAAFYYRASGERSRYYGYAVASSPLEGAAQGTVRAGMGLLESVLAPFPPYNIPFYEYDLGSSVADPGFAKAGFGMYHIASSPLDIPGAVIRRVSGEKSAHSGFAVAFSPVEGAVQGITRSGVGAYHLISWPFPQYPVEPPYGYPFGLSPIDKALEGFMRGGENIEICPLELPVTMHHAVMDRGLGYGSAYGLVMGPTRMVIRLGAGLLEMTTCGAPNFEPIYDVSLGENMPDLFRERPRLKRPLHKPPQQ